MSNGPEFFQTRMGQSFYEVMVPRLVKALERIAETLEGKKEPDKELKGEPVFNHTRADGPFDPCPICLLLMSKKQLRTLVGDLRGCVEDLRKEKMERENEDP